MKTSSDSKCLDKVNLRFFFVIFFAGFLFLSETGLPASLSDPLKSIPVLFKGRFIPLQVYVKNKIKEFPESSDSLSDAEVVRSLVSMHFLGPENQSEKEFNTFLSGLKNQNISPLEIKRSSELYFPIKTRLERAGNTFLALPSAQDPGKWYSLRCLGLQVYDEQSDKLRPITNFTFYDNLTFSEIQKSYLDFKSAFEKNSFEKEAAALSEALLKGYSSLAGRTYRIRGYEMPGFPSLFRLKLEVLLDTIPIALYLWLSYSLCILFFMISYLYPRRTLSFTASFLCFCVFFLHTAYLIARCYLLSGPPVSNMAETVLFVPWIAVLSGFSISIFYRTTIPIFCACIGASVLFALLKFSNINLDPENVRAVLNSRFWLTVHVLAVVSSYGAFILAGILGHLYLAASIFPKIRETFLENTGKTILYSILIGLGLLIPGTILGGVWAAQSWGRFWDWDPKESWAFITACTYLISIHAYYFKIIRDFGLAISSIVGLTVVGFTWYGVNYILGTGLHSYGFGKGGESFFYLYLFVEINFLVFISLVRYLKSPYIENHKI